MDNYNDWLSEMESSPDFWEISQTLRRLSIRMDNVHAYCDDVTADNMFAKLPEIIDSVIKQQTEETTRVCSDLLKNWNRDADRCRFCPTSRCSFSRGNCVLRVPLDVFPKVEDEFDTVIHDIRGSFQCKCRGGVGANDCDYDCVVAALSKMTGTWMRPYAPEMDSYFEDQSSEVYPVKPYIEEVQRTSREVLFRLHVYTDRQAAGVHHRIRDLLSEESHLHRRWRIVALPGDDDSRTEFNKIFTATGKVSRYAGAIPKDSIVMPPHIVSIVGPRLREFRKDWNLPSLNVRAIPCNVHRMMCFTCADPVSPDIAQRILDTLKGISHDKS